MKTVQEIKSNFEQILTEVIKINGIPIESAVPVATVILQESGKFERTEMLNDSRNYNNGNSINRNSNGSQPATEKQKNAMRSMNIAFSENISKSNASKLIDSAIYFRNNRGKGASQHSFPK